MVDVTTKVARAALALLAAAAIGVTATSAPTGALSLPPAEHAWVGKAYRDILDRPPTAAQLDHRVDQMDSGVSRREIADELVASREHAQVIVARLYERILGRPADPASFAYWREELVAGARPTTVASFLYGSPELYTEAGGTAEGYVAFLYRDVLGREPDAAGLAYWSDRIEGGENRTRLARAWLLTPEATGLRAGVLFLDILHRPPSETERADWGGRLRRFDERRVLAALVASSESASLATQHKPSIRLTSGNGHSRQPSISADGRIIAFASTATNLTPGGSPPGEDIFVIDRLTGRTRAITAGNRGSSRPDVSADGSTVVFQSQADDLVEGTVRAHGGNVFQASTAGGPITLLSPGEGGSSRPSVNADGTIVVFDSTDWALTEGEDADLLPDVYVRTAVLGQEPTLERLGFEGYATNAHVSADGSTLVFDTASEGELPIRRPMVVPLPLGADPEPEPLADVQAAQVTVTADGSRVAYLRTATSPFTVVVADLGEGGPTATELPGSEDWTSPRISGDGSHLLVTDNAPNPRIDRIVRHDGAQDPFPITLPIDSDLNADGSLVVGSLAGQIRLYEP